MGRNRPVPIGGVRYRSKDDCPDVAKHSKEPSGYLAWHEWAEKKAKTHDQLQCPTCGFFAIWNPKTAGAGLRPTKGE